MSQSHQTTLSVFVWDGVREKIERTLTGRARACLTDDRVYALRRRVRGSKVPVPHATPGEAYKIATLNAMQTVSERPSVTACFGLVETLGSSP